MKIVYLAHSRIPSHSANSVHVMRMCGGFASLGHKINLITPDQGEEVPGVDDVFAYYGVKDHFSITKVPINQGRAAKKRLVGARMADLARQCEPDFVYARHLPAALVAASFGLPVFYEIHHLPEKSSGWAALAKSIRQHAEGLRRQYLGRDADLRSLHKLGALGDPASMFKRLASFVPRIRVVVITHALKRAMLACYPEFEGFIEVAPDGANLPAEDTSPAPLRGPPADLQVGYTGNLHPGKGMEIMAALAQQCPWANFHIIGGREEQLRYWKNTLQPYHNVFFYGRVSPHAVDSYLKSFDVCILPNQPRMHPLSSSGRVGADIAPFTSPLKMFEYMAAGKAIVASDLDVLKEVLHHGSNCLLCKHDDPRHWALALERLRMDPGLRSQLGSEARQAFCSKYEWSARARRITEIFTYPESFT